MGEPGEFLCEYIFMSPKVEKIYTYKYLRTLTRHFFLEDICKYLLTFTCPIVIIYISSHHMALTGGGYLYHFNYGWSCLTTTNIGMK